MDTKLVSAKLSKADRRKAIVDTAAQLFAEVGFRGGMGLDGPLLRFFEAELAAFVAWAGEQGTRGASLWDYERRLVPMALAWFGGFAPSAPRQVWFKGACLDAAHQPLFADLAVWRPA